MRKDICNELLNFKEDEIILNKNELARRFNCSRNTVDRYLKRDKCFLFFYSYKY